MSNQLLQVRKNVFYTKNEKGKYERYHEMVLVLDKPLYTRTNEGDVLRERACEEVRFTIASDSNYDKFIEILTQLKDAKEEDLT